MAFDLLSDVLDLPHVRGGAFGTITAGGPWAIATTTGNDISFCAVTRGTTYYRTQSMSEAVMARAGDVVVLGFSGMVEWGSEPDRKPTVFDDDFTRGGEQNRQFGDGDDFHMIAGGFLVDRSRHNLFQSTLPKVMHISGSLPEAAPLRWLVEQLFAELRNASLPGRTTIIGAICQMLFAHSLRAYLATAAEPQAGWLRVFRNPRLLRALEKVHSAPSRNWSVDELARLAGMSRSNFSNRFHQTMGMPPLTYLAKWRMRLAMDALRGGASIADAAQCAGYGSERAFNTAFRRMTSITPGAFRRSIRDEASKSAA